MVSALRSQRCTMGTAAVLRDASARPEPPAGITDSAMGPGDTATTASPLISHNLQVFEDLVSFSTNILGKTMCIPHTPSTA